MTKKFWTFSALTVYIYTITILEQFGYNQYFGIPYNFVESSITVNVVYAFSLSHLVLSMAGAFFAERSVQITLVVAVAIFIGYIYIRKSIYIYRPKGILPGLLFILAIVFLWQSVRFGTFLAKMEGSYYVLPVACGDLDKNLTYIVPNFYDGKALVVPVDADKKMVGTFFVQDVSTPVCQLKFEYIGIVK